MDDFRKILYGVVIGFIAIIVGWVSFLTYSGCGFSLDNCNASVPKIERTSIPSLVPATLPAPVRFLVSTATASATSAATATTAPTESVAAVASTITSPMAASASPTNTSPVAASVMTSTPAAGSGSGVPRPSNPGGPGDAINLTGDPNSGAQIFATNCVTCHNAQGKGGIPNLGSDAGSCPALNPINPALKSSDHMTFVTNLDLFVQHGSTPAGPGPTYSMPPWGDSGKMTQQQIADVIAYVISLNP
jgi:mono/diheme cytochrome c family protein